MQKIMADLQSIEKIKLEKLFGMSSGYVLDFSDRTFGDFVLEITGIDIYTDEYAMGGTSKANRLRMFWKKESNGLVAKLIRGLLEYWRTQKLISDTKIVQSEQILFEEVKNIAGRLDGSDIKITSGLIIEAAGEIKHSGETHALNNQAVIFRSAKNVEQSGKIKFLDKNPKPQSFNINNSQIHFGNGDIKQKNIMENKKTDKKWWQRPEIFLPIIIAAVSIPWLPNLLPFLKTEPDTRAEAENTLATSTINIASIIDVHSGLKTSLERNSFLDKYKDTPIIGEGLYTDIGGSPDRYLVLIKISANTVTCEFTSEWEKRLNLLKIGQKIKFSGKFQVIEFRGSFWVNECTLLS